MEEGNQLVTYKRDRGFELGTTQNKSSNSRKRYSNPGQDRRIASTMRWTLGHATSLSFALLHRYGSQGATLVKSWKTFQFLLMMWRTSWTKYTLKTSLRDYGVEAGWYFHLENICRQIFCFLVASLTAGSLFVGGWVWLELKHLKKVAKIIVIIRNIWDF